MRGGGAGVCRGEVNESQKQLLTLGLAGWPVFSEGSKAVVNKMEGRSIAPICFEAY